MRRMVRGWLWIQYTAGGVRLEKHRFFDADHRNFATTLRYIRAMIWPDAVETTRLVLRRPVIDDAPAIFDGYARDPEVVRYLMWHPHASIADTTNFLASVAQRLRQETEQSWAITLKGDNHL